MEERAPVPAASPCLRGVEEALGAAFVEVAGRSVPRHYRDAAEEYRAVREEAGVADRGDRARIRLWGRDPVKMVQGLVTNDVSGAPAGRAVYAAMLSPKGRTLAEMRILRREGAQGPEVLLDLPREALAGTAEHLKKFVPPMFARWGDVSDDVGEIGVYGPRARRAVSTVLASELPELAEDEFVEVEHAGDRVLVLATREAGGEEGFDLFAPCALLPRLWSALLEAGARPVGRATLETLRVEAGRPRWGADMDEETIATEAFEGAGLMERAISFHKGCYTGQEVIVRIAHRGHVNRLLRGLLLGDGPVPTASDALHHPETGRSVGRVTSVAYSPLLGQTVALGYVRREVEPGGALRVGGAEGPEARVVALPFRRAGSP